MSNSSTTKVSKTDLYCSCKKPTLIKNKAGGAIFDVCTTCKKEWVESPPSLIPGITVSPRKTNNTTSTFQEELDRLAEMYFSDDDDVPF